MNPIKKGKKTKAWDLERAKLKVKFLEAGITSCEARLEGCWKGQALSFAHVDKRRNLGVGELSKVILACVPCHQLLEKLNSEEMRGRIETIIAARTVKI